MAVISTDEKKPVPSRGRNRETSTEGCESDSYETVYVKEHVCMHPTPLAQDRIPGRLLLLRHRESLFLSWIPYSPSAPNVSAAGIPSRTAPPLGKSKSHIEVSGRVNYDREREIRVAAQSGDVQLTESSDPNPNTTNNASGNRAINFLLSGNDSLRAAPSLRSDASSLIKAFSLAKSILSTNQGRASTQRSLSTSSSSFLSPSLSFSSSTSSSSASAVVRHLYTIRSLSVREIRSVRRHTPAFGWHYVIIVLTQGLAFPPLYFHLGGVKEFVSVLREHTLLVKSSADPNVFLVINEAQDPLERSLTSLNLRGVMRSIPSPRSSRAEPVSPSLSLPTSSTSSSSSSSCPPYKSEDTVKGQENSRENERKHERGEKELAEAEQVERSLGREEERGEENLGEKKSSEESLDVSTHPEDGVSFLEDRKEMDLKDLLNEDPLIVVHPLPYNSVQSSVQFRSGGENAPGGVGGGKNAVLGGRRGGGGTVDREEIEEKVKQATSKVLEKFSLVTKFARDMFSSSQGDDFIIGGKEAEERLPGWGEEERASEGESKALSGWSNKTARHVNEEGEREEEEGAGEREGEREGVGAPSFEDLSFDGEVSLLLLREKERERKAGEGEKPEEVNFTSEGFEVVDSSHRHFRGLSPALVLSRPRPPPLSKEEFLSMLDEEGRVIDSQVLRRRIFQGGVQSDELRKEVWKFLLGVFPYDSTRLERVRILRQKRREYEMYRFQWKSVSTVQSRRFAKYKERCSRVDKDVVRTDRHLLFYAGDDSPNLQKLRNILITFSFYNFDLGYCQGMNDLLSPILFVMKEESDAFWCFCGLMDSFPPSPPLSCSLSLSPSLLYGEGREEGEVGGKDSNDVKSREEVSGFEDDFQVLNSSSLETTSSSPPPSSSHSSSRTLSSSTVLPSEKANGGEGESGSWVKESMNERDVGGGFGLDANFHRDQNGMHVQLLALAKLVRLLDRPLYDYLGSIEALNFFFCFRWILIQFKREFSTYAEIQVLWEALWCRIYSKHFHLYIAVALLKRNRRKIMDDQMEFDDLLRFINDLSGHINVEETLRDAEALCIYAGKEGEACLSELDEALTKTEAILIEGPETGADD